MNLQRFEIDVHWVQMDAQIFWNDFAKASKSCKGFLMANLTFHVRSDGFAHVYFGAVGI